MPACTANGPTPYLHTTEGMRQLHACKGLQLVGSAWPLKRVCPTRLTQKSMLSAPPAVSTHSSCCASGRARAYRHRTFGWRSPESTDTSCSSCFTATCSQGATEHQSTATIHKQSRNHAAGPYKRYIYLFSSKTVLSICNVHLFLWAHYKHIVTMRSGFYGWA